MKNIKIIKVLAAIVVLMHLTACSDFLEVEIPKDQMDEGVVFNDDKTATAAVAHLYTLLWSNGFLSGNKEAAGYLLACYTDEMEVTVTQETNYRTFYELAVLPMNVGVKNLWDYSYRHIYVANSILEGVDQSQGISAPVKQQLTGEALAIRALIHFYLTQTYGDVPYVNTTDYLVNQKIGKATVVNVLQNAVKDLKLAEELLTDDYPTVERVRLNKAAAQALLARIYLYMEDYPNARYYAEQVIQNSKYQMEPLDRVFLKESKSAVWQLKPAALNGNTLEGMHYIFTNSPAPFAKISKALENDFETDDKRYDQWLKGVGNESKEFHSNKYRQRGATTPSQEYSVVLRLEEQYLIAAEAAANMQDWSAANDYLNAVRGRAGLLPVALNDLSSAEKVILHERRVELFCEFGHRFYDLKRLNQLEIISKVKTSWSSYMELLPLPENEIFLNSNLLPQNTGY